MGDGRFVGGTLTFMVSALYALTIAERTAWETAIQRASDFLFAATGGQVEFGEVFLVDDNFGRLSADIVLLDGNGLTVATQGEFGTPGAAFKYYRHDRGSVDRSDRRRIVSNSMSRIVVDADYPDPPTNSPEAGSGWSARADQLHTAMHTTAARLSARTGAPRFRRQIPIRFQVIKGR